MFTSSERHQILTLLELKFDSPPDWMKDYVEQDIPPCDLSFFSLMIQQCDTLEQVESLLQYFAGAQYGRADAMRYVVNTLLEYRKDMDTSELRKRTDESETLLELEELLGEAVSILASPSNN